MRTQRWHHENVVLLGDAAHTAHFSIGSGTKLAMEDAIALADALERARATSRRALTEYEQGRKPRVEALQQAAARASATSSIPAATWISPPLQFMFHLLTRSGRITYDN